MSRRIGIKHMRSVGGKRRFVEFRDPSGEDGGYYDNRGPFDPAYTYDNAPSGQGEIREPTGSDGGAYDNRA